MILGSSSRVRHCSDSDIFTVAVNRWIDLQNLVLYKSLRDNGVSVQQHQQSTDNWIRVVEDSRTSMVDEITVIGFLKK